MWSIDPNSLTEKQNQYLLWSQASLPSSKHMLQINIFWGYFDKADLLQLHIISFFSISLFSF